MKLGVQRFYFALFVLILIPISLWLSQQGIESRFSDSSSALTSIGKILGMSGFVLFSFNLILSARFRFLEKIFLPINQLYSLHHKLGGTAFILLLFHPIFLTSRFLLDSVAAAANFIWPSLANLPQLYGTLALFTMILVLGITFYLKLKYHHWKLSHKFMGLAYSIALLHLFFIPSDIAINQPLRYYLLSLGAIALLSYLYHSIFYRFLALRFRYELTDKKVKSKDIIELILKPLGKKINFQPGQFAFFVFQANHLSRESQPFSFTSAPSETNLRIAFKDLGDFTRELQKIKTGSTVKIEGPYGCFFEINYLDKDKLLIAGGIGITPFLSIFRSLTKINQKIDIIYSVTKPEEAAFLKELKDIERSKSNLKIIPYYSQEQGRVTLEKISKMTGNLKEKEVYICGPKGMMRSLKQELIMRGLSSNQIHTEEFDL